MILLIVISRGFGYTWEQDLIACTSVVMFCNVLNIVTPFKFIGVCSSQYAAAQCIFHLLVKLSNYDSEHAEVFLNFGSDFELITI